MSAGADDPSTGATDARTRADPWIARRTRPVDPPMTPFAFGGTVVWAVLGVLAFVFRADLAAAGRGSWPWICVVGFLFGLAGTVVMLRHDSRRRAAPSGPDAGLNRPR